MNRQEPERWIVTRNNHAGGRRSICVQVSELGPAPLICDEVRSEEDAALIAAAPELLGLVRDAVAAFDAGAEAKDLIYKLQDWLFGVARKSEAIREAAAAAGSPCIEIQMPAVEPDQLQGLPEGMVNVLVHVKEVIYKSTVVTVPKDDPEQNAYDEVSSQDDDAFSWDHEDGSWEIEGTDILD